MKVVVICIGLITIMTLACTRRPDQKDVVLDHNSMNNSSSDHGHMMSSPGAAQAPYELQFIDTMIAHHEAAIDAAQLVATRGQHNELKQLAKSIIEDQRREISQMRQWRSDWYGGKPEAVNMELPGMREGMAEMDIEKLDPLKENRFDLEFIRQMIPHHQGALTMAKDVIDKTIHPELRDLAEGIIQTQTDEIEEMRSWEKEWGGN